MYIVEFTDAALDDLNSLGDERTKQALIRIVKKELTSFPKSKGKTLGRSKSSGIIYYEKRFMFGAGYRVYYNVIEGIVVVDKVEYEGISRINRASTKKTQKKVLRDLGLK